MTLSEGITSKKYKPWVWTWWRTPSEFWTTQIIGLPAWAVGYLSDRFNFEATFSGEKPPSEQLRLMLRSALVERFGMKFHRGTRILPVFAMVVDSKGVRMKLRDSSQPLPIPPLRSKFW
jgi:uncharacterized protein (TIGR03435 family)